MTYEIRIIGQLSDRWQGWFEGFTIERAGNETILVGSVTDQSALHGVLRRVRDLGVTLISVTKIDTQ